MKVVTLRTLRLVLLKIVWLSPGSCLLVVFGRGKCVLNLQVKWHMVTSSVMLAPVLTASSLLESVTRNLLPSLVLRPSFVDARMSRVLALLVVLWMLTLNTWLTSCASLLATNAEVHVFVLTRINTTTDVFRAAFTPTDDVPRVRMALLGTVRCFVVLWCSWFRYGACGAFWSAWLSFRAW